MKKIIAPLLLLILPLTALAYTPSIGIPNPSDSFGSIDPIEDAFPPEPETWTSDQAGYYYIDNTDGSCSDLGRGNKSIPRCTLPEATDFTSQGDTVGTDTILIVLGGGPYTSTWDLSDLDGTYSHPVYVAGDGNETRTEFDSGGADQYLIFIEDSSYVFFQYLNFQGPDNAQIGVRCNETSDHILFRHSTWANFYTGASSTASALYIGMSSANNNDDEPNNYYVIYNCDFYSIGVENSDWSGESDIYERIGIKCEYGVDHVWILNNDFHQIGEDGVHILNYQNELSVGPHDGQPQYIYIGGNTSYQMGEQFVDIKESEHVIISQNTIHGQRDLYEESYYHGDAGSYGNCITMNDEGENQSADYSWIIFNTMYDNTYGIYSQSYNRNYIIGNLYYGEDSAEGYLGNYAIRRFSNNTNGHCDTYIVNNTIVNSKYPILVKTQNILNVENNIIYELVNQSNYHMRFSLYGTLSAQNNLFYDATEIRLYDSSYCTGDNSCYDGGSSTDPLFESVINNVYSLQSDSPAKSNGNESSVYDLYYSTYGISIEYDIVGFARSNWDIGAYEYQPTATISGTSF
jgi:hypothetical protein